MTITQRRRSLAAALLTAAILLTGCSASSADSAGSAARPAAVQPADAQPAAADAPADATEIITGTIWLTAADPIGAARTVTEIIVAAGGRIEDRDESASPELTEAHATLTARIPVAKIDDVREKLTTIGTVTQTQLASEDVGTAQRDLEARASSLRTSVERYESWLAAATTPKDLAELEESLSDRQTKLESIESEIRTMADKVAMSTITLVIGGNGGPDSTQPQTIGDALAVGWHGFVGFWSDTLLNVSVGLPWLVLLALAGAVTFVIMRRRQARARTAEAARPPARVDPAFVAAATPLPPQPAAPPKKTPPTSGA
ncbi:DUF4349 domain-containing protein [Microbacterium sp. ZW T5_56]|uniref:DUF4349 domain-containing protein n=1 Tax=Microbacterium sp. ZW T5_56 TaxID=3378081 RepID=UPI0038531331